MSNLVIDVRIGEKHLTDSVDVQILERMTPHARRRAFGTLMDQIYKALANA
jgi:hypothetical protein